MGFLPEGVREHNKATSLPYNPMRGVVSLLSPKAKQAMFAAATKGLIMRKTWNGCAFNKAGLLENRHITSVQVAAETFNMRYNDVSHFIGVWDGLNCGDREANKYLLDALSESGTHTPTGRGTKIIRGYAYKSEATKFAEQLESGELTVDQIPGCKEVGELLSASC